MSQREALEDGRRKKIPHRQQMIKTILVVAQTWDHDNCLHRNQISLFVVRKSEASKERRKGKRESKPVAK